MKQICRQKSFYLLLLLITAFAVFASELVLAESYVRKEDCISCHTLGDYYPDTHHMLVARSDYQCLACHQIPYDPQTNMYYLTTSPCMQCHAIDQIHPVHDNAHHLSAKTLVNCVNCHVGTFQTTLVNGAEALYVSYENTKQCGSCHQPPADEYLRLKNADVLTVPDSSIPERYVFSNMNDKDLAVSYMLNRSENKAITMKLNEEADLLSGVYLRLHVTELVGGPQTIRIYPYKSDGDNIDTGKFITHTLSSLNWDAIDITPLLQGMKGFGWVKFRVVNTMDSARVSEADFFVRYKNKIDPVSAMYLKFKGTGAFSSSNQGAYAEPASDYTIADQLKDNTLSVIPAYGYSVFKNKTESSAVVMRVDLDAGAVSRASLNLYAYLPYIKTKGAPGYYEPQTLKIYSYKSDGTNIDTSTYVTAVIHSPGWQSVDVTPLLVKMNGFGWLKFRITNSTRQSDLTEAFITVSRK